MGLDYIPRQGQAVNLGTYQQVSSRRKNKVWWKEDAGIKPWAQQTHPWSDPGWPGLPWCQGADQGEGWGFENSGPGSRRYLQSACRTPRQHPL